MSAIVVIIVLLLLFGGLGGGYYGYNLNLVVIDRQKELQERI
jgi:hypothetical protein